MPCFIHLSIHFPVYEISLMFQIIGQHQNILIAPGNSFINYTLLSNDNGFLSYYPHQFTQRTLLARFQMNFTSPKNNKNTNLIKHTKSFKDDFVYQNNLENHSIDLTVKDNENNAIDYQEKSIRLFHHKHFYRISQDSKTRIGKNKTLINVIDFDSKNSNKSYVMFIRKPIYSAMVLLSKLGDLRMNYQLQCEYILHIYDFCIDLKLFKQRNSYLM